MLVLSCGHYNLLSSLRSHTWWCSGVSLSGAWQGGHFLCWELNWELLCAKHESTFIWSLSLGSLSTICECDHHVLVGFLFFLFLLVWPCPVLLQITRFPLSFKLCSILARIRGCSEDLWGHFLPYPAWMWAPDHSHQHFTWQALSVGNQCQGLMLVIQLWSYPPALMLCLHFFSTPPLDTDCIQILAMVNRSAINTDGHIFFQISGFDFSGSGLRSRITGSYVSSICTFWENAPYCFPWRPDQFPFPPSMNKPSCSVHPLIPFSLFKNLSFLPFVVVTTGGWVFTGLLCSTGDCFWHLSSLGYDRGLCVEGRQGAMEPCLRALKSRPLVISYSCDKKWYLITMIWNCFPLKITHYEPFFSRDIFLSFFGGVYVPASSVGDILHLSLSLAPSSFLLDSPRKGLYFL